jgi:hypothetical protein
VAFDQGRKRPGAARFENARQQWLVAVTQVFDIVNIEPGSLGLEDCSRHGAFLHVFCVMSPEA